MTLHQHFPQSLLPFLLLNHKKCLFFRHYFDTQYFTEEERERGKIVIILQLPLQYCKHVQGERLSNNTSTAAAATCASHPLFSLCSCTLVV